MNNLLLFLFILDTGGWLFARPLVVILFLIKLLGKRVLIISKREILPWFILVILLLPSLINARGQNIPTIVSLTYIYPLLVFPIFLIFSNTLKLNRTSLFYVGYYFSATVILFFILRLINFGPVNGIVQYLQANPSSGFFDEKNAFFGRRLPVVYFKATLLLVPINILSLYYSKYTLYALTLLALVLAPSRTGVVVVVLFSLPNFYKKNRTWFKYILFFLLVYLAQMFYKNWKLISELFLFAGGLTRFTHIAAIVEYLQRNPWFIFFGAGPGSTFFSEAFINQENKGFTDDSEISQFEVLRRYGIFFLIYLIYLFKIVLKKFLLSRRKGDYYALLSYFIVSASNPVLLTAPAMFYYAITISTLKHSSDEC